MADPQQDAANREALLKRLLGGGELTPPPPIAPVASHPARDAVLLESRRRGDDMIQRARINETPEISLGEMRGIENDFEPGLEKWGITRSQMERMTELAMAMGPASLDDVAARMGKPLGSFKTVVEPDPHVPGGLSITIRDADPNKAYPTQAGWMDLGSKVVDDHLSVDLSTLQPEYRGKGMGRELYQEAIAEAQRRGFKGLASDPQWRNQYSNRMWDRPGVKKSQAGDFDLMAEYMEREHPPELTPLTATRPVMSGPAQPSGTALANARSQVGLGETLRKQEVGLMETLRRQMNPVASHPAKSEVLLAAGKPVGKPRVLDLAKFSAEDEAAISKAFGTDQWSVRMLREALQSEPEFAAKLPYDAWQHEWAGVPLTRMPKK